MNNLANKYLKFNLLKFCISDQLYFIAFLYRMCKNKAKFIGLINRFPHSKLPGRLSIQGN